MLIGLSLRVSIKCWRFNCGMTKVSGVSISDIGCDWWYNCSEFLIILFQSNVHLILYHLQIPCARPPYVHFFGLSCTISGTCVDKWKYHRSDNPNELVHWSQFVTRLDFFSDFHFIYHKKLFSKNIFTLQISYGPFSAGFLICYTITNIFK